MASDTSKAMKEEFVSGLNGTTFWEVNVIIHSSIILTGVKALLLAILPTAILKTKWTRFLVEYFTLVVPLIAITTVFADDSSLILGTTSALMIFAIAMLPRGEDNDVGANDATAVQLRRYATEELLHADYDLSDEDTEILEKSSRKEDSFWTAQILSLNRVPYITVYRSFVTIISCICILAVDFRIFPRRLAKTECFGTGLMDTGVGFFVVANGIVSPEARRGRYYQCRTIMERLKCILRSILTSWPLWVIGFLRCISVKLLGYQEHVSEYGVHWNFFFTLAVVRIFSAFLLSIFSVRFTAFLSVVSVSCYQVLLLHPDSNLTSLLMNNDREGFYMANKEGIWSSLGYISLYLASVNFGSFLFKVGRPSVLSWVQDYIKLIFACISFWIFTMLSDSYVQPISRRFANLSFVSWMLALTLSCFSVGLLLDFFLVFCAYCKKIPTEGVPEQIMLQEPLSKDGPKIFTPPPPSLSLLDAVNRNQFVYFLLSNLSTGVINIVFDTMTIPDSQALAILCFYMFCNLFFIWILHTKQIALKFW